MPVRKASPEDAKAIVALLLARGSSAGDSTAGEKIAREVEDCFLSDRTTVYIAQSGDSCLGYAARFTGCPCP